MAQALDTAKAYGKEALIIVTPGAGTGVAFNDAHYYCKNNQYVPCGYAISATTASLMGDIALIASFAGGVTVAGGAAAKVGTGVAARKLSAAAEAYTARKLALRTAATAQKSAVEKVLELEAKAADILAKAAEKAAVKTLANPNVDRKLLEKEVTASVNMVSESLVNGGVKVPLYKTESIVRRTVDKAEEIIPKMNSVPMQKEIMAEASSTGNRFKAAYDRARKLWVGEVKKAEGTAEAATPITLKDRYKQVKKVFGEKGAAMVKDTFESAGSVKDSVISSAQKGKGKLANLQSKVPSWSELTEKIANEKGGRFSKTMKQVLDVPIYVPAAVMHPVETAKILGKGGKYGLKAGKFVADYTVIPVAKAAAYVAILAKDKVVVPALKVAKPAVEALGKRPGHMYGVGVYARTGEAGIRMVYKKNMTVDEFIQDNINPKYQKTNKVINAIKTEYAGKSAEYMRKDIIPDKYYVEVEVEPENKKEKVYPFKK